MVIDYNKLVEAIKHYMAHPAPGYDLYLLAARRATGDDTLVLTIDQRRQVKLAAHAIVYGMGGGDFLNMLKRKGASA